MYLIKVKEAYEKLMDADQRKTTIMHVENVTSELKKERKRLLNAGVSINIYYTYYIVDYG